MQLRFRTMRLDEPGARWQKLFREYWPAYRAWFLKQGEGSRPSLAECRTAPQTHMPELIGVWE